jgi:hypothetical protein
LSNICFAQVVPENAKKYIPDLKIAISKIWPDMPHPVSFAGDIEQETCISLKHSKCWNPNAELKTSREYGFGLGQYTIAYHADGTERFNTWKDMKASNPALKEWTWENRFNSQLQLTAFVLKHRYNWGLLKFPIATEKDRLAFLYVTYNSGGTFKDRILCSQTDGCDPTKWYGNVELYSTKSKVKLKEYGNRSMFEISREYPKNVLDVRTPKYVPFFIDVTK